MVILNFHRFLPELDDLDDAALEEEELRHAELQGVLEAVFGADLFPFWPSRSGSLTLEECWRFNRRLVVSYNYPELQPLKSQTFWPEIKVEFAI